MTPERPDQDGIRLDAYLDGAMTDVERDAFEAVLADDAALRRQVECQSAIDASLRRLFTPPAPDAVDGRVPDRIPAPVRAPRVWWRMTAIAASVAAVMVGSWLAYAALAPNRQSPGAYRDQPWRRFEQVYSETIAAGFEPAWVCRDDEEFQSHFARRYGQPLVFEPPNATIAAVGLATCHTITRATTCVLGRVGDDPVIVFVDRIERDGGYDVPEEAELNLFRRTIGHLVLYELTPRDEPAMLAGFRTPTSGTSTFEPEG